ncbi:MAG: ABC transporter substrate-binding protein [Trichormus sp. ATA11-4-KO1]|jgi:branched-chain amino acid transport system substrate-binding protein|nr:ABC transporter substrate-binding protein [Trichormus sp. ATA11-4-KO1]
MLDFILRHPQNVAVVLEISGGSFDAGFPVTLKVLQDAKTIKEYEDFICLPAAPEMPQLYKEWQGISLDRVRKWSHKPGNRKLEPVPDQVTNVAWAESTRNLEKYCKSWFNNEAFERLSDRIRADIADIRVNNDQSVPIIIRCPTHNHNPNELLRRLPWHLWDLFTELPKAEFTLFSGFAKQVPALKAPVKVLAIFGSSHGGLQLEKDQAALNLLQKRGAKITLKSQPTDQELSDLLFNHSWDILLFSGHSCSDRTNIEDSGIQIGDGDFFKLNDLRQGLRRAVTRGLKLAIFNSCDGLGIADFLARLKVPAVIVMREPVPDEIACQFLLDFLQQFSQGIPLFRAVREARDRLEPIQRIEFPAASWLPAVCLNPNQPELVWPEPSLLSRCQSYLSRPYLMTGVVLAGIIAVATPVAMHRCQIFPSICLSPLPPLDDYISIGEKPIANSKVQLSEPYLSLKQQGITAFSQNQYADAAKIFEQLRHLAQQNKAVPSISQAAFTALQDPIVLISRNNAFVMHRHSQNPDLPIYTIAVAAPLNFNAGLDIVFGVAQAQDVAVQQGINLQVVIANDNNNTEQARGVAKMLKEDANVLAVVGHYTSPNTCAALKVYSHKPHPLVVISPTSSLVNLPSSPACGGDPYKVFFRTVSSSRVEAQSLVQYLVEVLKKPQPKVVAFYNSQELFSKDLLEQFILVLRAFKGSIVAEFDLADPKLDIGQLPPQVQDADALAVLADGGTDDNVAFAKAIEIIKLNERKKPVLAANPLYLQEVIDQTKDATVNSLFLAVDWHPKQCGAQAFAQQINEYWGGDLNRRTALAYEAVQAVLQAIKLSDSPITREDIRQKLANTGIIKGVAASSATSQGVSISFDARGDRREITTRGIVTVNEQLRFDLVKDDSCPHPQ